MATFRDTLLPAVDVIRGIPTVLGLRPHVVAIFTRTWSGDRVGQGTKTDVVTGVYVNLAVGQVKVRNASQADVVSSGGLLTSQDLIVGPITPPYTGSTLDNTGIPILDPPPPNSPSEVFWQIQGPGYSPQGDLFKRIGARFDQSFRFMIWLRKTGAQT
jgi:hypothetical protein